MKMILDERFDVPVASESDILIVGGGWAGVAAAVAAARLGKNVTILEKTTVLGGLCTIGQVVQYLPICDGLGRKVYGGLAEEFLHTSVKYSYNNIPDERWKMGVKRIDNPKGRYRTTFNVPALVLTLDELTEELGINVIFDALVVRPVMEGDYCRGVIAEDKSGRKAYLGKIVIDASGDADVFYRAGAECEDVENIISFNAYELDLKTCSEGVDGGEILKTIKLHLFGLRPNADNSRSKVPTFHGTSTEGVNGYIRVSRGLGLEYLKTQAGRQDYAMLSIPFMQQFRMTRRILGKSEFKLNLGHIPNSVGCVIHSLENPAAVHEFPYEGLIDSRIRNMFAAGRIVAAGGYAWEIMRCVPACVFTGQAAGTAAVLAIDSGCDVQDVDIEKLQSMLAETGVMIHMDEDMLGGHSEKTFWKRQEDHDGVKTSDLMEPGDEIKVKSH